MNAPLEHGSHDDAVSLARELRGVTDEAVVISATASISAWRRRRASARDAGSPFVREREVDQGKYASTSTGSRLKSVSGRGSSGTRRENDVIAVATTSKRAYSQTR